MRVLGLISGTSMDGIDVALAELRIAGESIELAPLGHHTHAYPERLRERLLAALPPGDCDAATLCALDTEVGQAFAAAASEASTTHRADLVASLGQTIYHWVQDNRCLGTLQLGQPAWIAEATGLPVVADLRARDVAAGGHGAPLATTLDELWLRGLGERPAAALNIGGIANITVAGGDAPTVGYDTGPGNALLDLAWRRHFGDGYDNGGALAATGTVHAELLRVLLADPYYAAPGPKSTGKEHFHAGYLDTALAQVTGGADLPVADLLATLTELTAITVAEACRRHGVRTVLVSGGGAANATLLSRLAGRLAPADLRRTDEAGLPVDGKEAYLAALLGYLSVHGIGANVPAATGAAGARLLGSITPGAGPLRLPEPVTHPITELTIATPVGRHP